MRVHFYLVSFNFVGVLLGRFSHEGTLLHLLGPFNYAGAV